MNGSDYSTTTLPLLFVSISIVVTFLVTRLIRGGKVRSRTTSPRTASTSATPSTAFSRCWPARS